MQKYLPRRIRAELDRLLSSRKSSYDEISELRLRSFGNSSVYIGGERILLCTQLGEDELGECVSLMCEGSLYSKRDGIREGYISLSDGVRVGICGRARYDGGALVGVSEVSSLVIRVPSVTKADIAPLFDAWKNTERGLLIYSPPGVGKTTALRSLVGYIGSLRQEVAVIDERCEFVSDDYKRSSVDILRGYKRDVGMEIALRTLSPDVIAVDEIGKKSEAEAMLESLNSGVKIIATAHASSLDTLRERPNMRPFFESDVFDSFVGISLVGKKREYTVLEKCVT